MFLKESKFDSAGWMDLIHLFILVHLFYISSKSVVMNWLSFVSYEWQMMEKEQHWNTLQKEEVHQTLLFMGN